MRENLNNHHIRSWKGIETINKNVHSQQNITFCINSNDFFFNRKFTKSLSSGVTWLLLECYRSCFIPIKNLSNASYTSHTKKDGLLLKLVRNMVTLDLYLQDKWAQRKGEQNTNL